jgi:DNA adenine methylase
LLVFYPSLILEHYPFFYVDPPYVDSNQGHYGGYTQEHFNSLLDLLSKVQGKFLLSSYPNTALSDYSKNSNWTTKNIEMSLSASQVSGRKKIEVLTSNF